MKLARMVLVLAVIMSVGCHRKVVVTNTPTGVSATSVQNWYAAVGIYKEIGDYTNQLTQATIQLKADFPSQDAYDATLAGFGRADQIGIQAGLYLQSVPQTWQDTTGVRISDYATQIANQVDLAVNSGLSGVKDSAKKQAILTLVASVKLAVSTAVALNKPATGGTN